MRNLRLFLISSVVCSLLAGGLAFRAQGSLYSRDQIDQMVAPIALYPDALMSQVLMAATYPEQVADADQWVRANPDLTGSELDDALATATWDPSVIALCKFPTVLDKMADNIKWTSDLGNAFLNQKADVMDAVQSLRRAAYQSGHLQTTPQQRVVVQPQTIVIEPYAPDVIYVPAYQPAVVYGPIWSYPTYYYPTVWAPAPGVSFVNGFFWGLGFTIEHVLFGGCDWYHHDVFVNNTVIVNNRIFHNTPYYRRGYWHGHYGHQPWNHHYGRIDYAHVRSGAPYGGRSHGHIRGVERSPGSLQTHRIDHTVSRGPSALPDRRASRPAAHGPTGHWESHASRQAARGLASSR